MFVSRKNNNLALAVFLVAAAGTAAAAANTASGNHVRGVHKQHRVRSLQGTGGDERSLDLLDIVTGSGGPEGTSVAEDAGGAAASATIAEDAGKKKDDKKKDDNDKDKDKDKSKDNGGGGSGSGGGGGGTTPNRQQDEPCGDIDCAVTVDKPVVVQQCTNELAALNNCLRTREDGITYTGGVPRQIWWYVHSVSLSLSFSIHQRYYGICD